MSKVRNFLICVFVFFVSLIVAIGLLVLSAFLPQEPIDANVLASAYQLLEEETTVFDHSYASMMSTTSETLMFMESKSMNMSDPLSILSNPRYVYGSDLDAQENLLHYAQGEEAEQIDPYSRYWMGFRVTLRLLLQKLDYYQIKRYTAVCFFVLAFLTICSISENINSKVAFIFACSFVLVRPHIIAISLQSFTCFAIAFISILAIPWVFRHSKWEHAFFMEIGIITMYFDFYTFPPLTLGLPLIYLYMLHWHNDTEYSLKKIIINSISWFLGYVCMWISKLIITTLFTKGNDIAGGLRQLMYWLQSDYAGDNFDMDCGPFSALYHVALTLIYDDDGKHILLCAIGLILAVFLIRYIRTKPSFSVFYKNIGLLLIAAIPIFWFAIASKPTVIHHYYQYRSIAVTFCAGICYLFICTDTHNKKQHSI